MASRYCRFASWYWRMAGVSVAVVDIGNQQARTFGPAGGGWTAGGLAIIIAS